MSTKAVKKTRKPGPKISAQQAPATYPVGAEDLDQQQERLRSAAATGAGTLKSTVPAGTAAQAPIPETPAPKPLAPLAAVWPGSAPAPGVSNQPAVPAAQKTPAASVTPKVSPAPAAPALKASVQPSSPPLPKKAADPAQSPSAPVSVNVSFALFKPEAGRVSLCGEFNGWSSEAAPMERRENGRWEKTLSLRPGKYQYKFVADGQWLTDPAARENVPNGQGSLNSVMEVP